MIRLSHEVISIMECRTIARGRNADEPTLPVVLAGPKGAVLVNALIDTGSTMCSADQGLLDQLGLRPHGVTPVQTIVGVSNVAVYTAEIRTTDGCVLLPAGSHILGDSLPPPIQVLIGRDVLAGAKLNYDGPGGAWRLDWCSCGARR